MEEIQFKFVNKNCCRCNKPLRKMGLQRKNCKNEKLDYEYRVRHIKCHTELLKDTDKIN